MRIDSNFKFVDLLAAGQFVSIGAVVVVACLDHVSFVLIAQPSLCKCLYLHGHQMNWSLSRCDLDASQRHG